MARSSATSHVPPAEDLERFAYVAWHDMAEPLRLVSGYLGLIRHSLPYLQTAD